MINNKTIVLDTPEQINSYRMICLEKGLKLELKGLRLTRGRTCYSIIKEEFGLKGNKQRVYDQFTKMMEESK
jgi:hypothetical protein